MTGSIITVREFEERLAAICTGGGGTGFPKRERDVAVMLASATLWLKPGSVYSEPEINDGLAHWLEAVCPSRGLDPVSLRRELIDRNYLNRDDAGASYAPGPGPPEWRFEDGVAGVDPASVIADVARERDERKRSWAARQPGSSP